MKSIEIAITSLSTDTLAVSIDYRLETSPIVKKWHADRAVVDGIWDAIRDAVEDALREAAGPGGAPELNEEIGNSLSSLGLALFQEIVRDECDRIRDLAAGAVLSSDERPYIIFKIDKALAYLPLEMMHDGRAFLCHSLPVGRVLYAEDAEVRVRPAERGPHSVVIVGDPSEDSAISRDVEREIDAVRGVFRSRRDFALRIAMGREADQRRILADAPGATVLHLSGHGVTSDDERFAGVRLADGKVLSGYSLKGLQNAPVFAFLNICAPVSKATWKGSLGLVETLLRRGTRACIASLWDLRSPSAAFFAARFYDHLLAGVTFGEALRRARLETAEKIGFHDPTWAAYALYGDPRLVLIAGIPLAGPRGARETGTGSPGAVAAAHPRGRKLLRQAAFLAALVVLAALILIPVATMRERPDQVVQLPPAASDTQAAATAPGAIEEPVDVGYLVVESTPGDARVFLDGVHVGMTPNAFEATVGKHELLLDKPGYKQWEASVDVRHSRRTPVEVTLEKLKR